MIYWLNQSSIDATTTAVVPMLMIIIADNVHESDTVEREDVVYNVHEPKLLRMANITVMMNASGARTPRVLMIVYVFLDSDAASTGMA